MARIGPEVGLADSGEVENPPIICFGCRVRLTRRRNTRKPNLAVMERDVPTGPSEAKVRVEFEKGFDK